MQGCPFSLEGKEKRSDEPRPEPGKFESSLGLTAIRVHVVELPSSQAAISLLLVVRPISRHF